MLPGNILHFVKSFSKLPGIGPKSAEKLGFEIIGRPMEYAQELAEAIVELKRNSHICHICGNMDIIDPCMICSNDIREQDVLCVVEDPVDLYSIEDTRSFKGLYHVLGGVIDPLHGVSPQDLNLASLVKRVGEKQVKEIIFATSPTTEGDTTALYIREMLKNRGIHFTHLARGIPVGTDLQYAGTNSLTQALKNREVWK